LAHKASVLAGDIRVVDDDIVPQAPPDNEDVLIQVEFPLVN